MARSKGLLPFSGNFEPQVAGPFDARTVVGTVAELVLAATWTAKDGNVYSPVGLQVLVNNDTEANNGTYFLPVGKDYSVAGNWVKDGGNSSGTGGGNGGSTIQTIEVNELSDLDNLNLSENLYIIKGGVKGQLIVVDDEAIVYTAELSGFVCVKEDIIYSGKLDGFVCAYKPMINNLITAHLDEANNIYAAAQYPVDSVVNVQLTFTIEGASAATRNVVIYPGNTKSSLRYSTGPLMEYYVSQVSSVGDSSYNYIFTSSF